MISTTNKRKDKQIITSDLIMGSRFDCVMIANRAEKMTFKKRVVRADIKTRPTRRDDFLAMVFICSLIIGRREGSRTPLIPFRLGSQIDYSPTASNRRASTSLMISSVDILLQRRAKAMIRSRRASNIARPLGVLINLSFASA